MSLRFLAAAVFALVLAAPAAAQLVYHKDMPAGDATPTNGTFSIRFPVTFADTEMKASTLPVIVRMLTGTNSDNIRFSASETEMLGPEPLPMEDFIKATAQRPGAVVSDEHHETKDGMDVLSFELEDNIGGYFFRMMRHNSIQYMQIIQFPKDQRAAADAMRGDFFGSFKLTKP